MTDLATSLRYLKGAGPARARALARLGLETTEDLLEHFPRAYLDRSRLTPLGSLRPGSEVTVSGSLRSVSLRRRPGGRPAVHALLEDDSGRVECVWFNQAYLRDRLKRGMPLLLSGRVDLYRTLRLVNPEFEPLEVEAGPDGEPLPPGIVPVYPLTAGFSQRMMRRLVRQALEGTAGQRVEFVAADLLAAHDLVGWSEALEQVHFPESTVHLQAARRRLAFQEFFDLQLLLAVSRALYERPRTARSLEAPGVLAKTFLEALPFRLTGAQERAIECLRGDLGRDCPMHRLLEGDVGSGKTVVALAAALQAIEAGAQVAFMAPTGILAEQHAATFARLGAGLPVESALLTGGLAAREADRIRAAAAAGEIDLLIGTHALVQKTVTFRALGLVIVDEQHRFGVAQRALLLAKGAAAPHALIMTATPIPRTLALTLFGDLDITRLDEKPPGRRPPRTRPVVAGRYGDMLEYIAEQLDGGAQAYFVAPMIEASEELDLRAAEELYERLRDGGPLRRFRGGLIHGRMKGEEKRRVMAAFTSGETAYLVSTTVIEVGLDVPNASLMVIEHPERYGLSQLHQLRGRIGRGRQPAHLFLVLHPGIGAEARARLAVLQKEQDGFRIAEADLRLRGPGEFFGVRQSGLPPFRIADPVSQPKLLEEARQAAQAWVAREGVPAVRESALWRRLELRFGEGIKLYGVG